MPVAKIESLNLGAFLQIAYGEGIRSQISQDYRDWEMVRQLRKGAPDGRQFNFMFQKSYGPAAVQYRGVTEAAFPRGQQITTSEHTATYKEIDATIEIEWNLWNRARKSPSKYAEPLAMEIQSKTIAAKRRMAADLYGDGTGVVGTADGAATDNAAADRTVVKVSDADDARGHLGFFEYSDLLVPYTQAGVAVAPTLASGTFYAYRVVSKNRRQGEVTLEPVDSNYQVVDLTSSNIADTNVFYRIGQQTKPNLTSIGSADYGTLTEVWAGLETLAAADGRVVHGITMEGSSAGTQLDDGVAATLDVDHLQEILDDLKLNVGQSAYSYKKAISAPESIRGLLATREDKRQFQTVEDNKRGIKFFAYVHGNDTVELQTSEFCPKRRLWVLPEAKNGNKVLECHSTDFEAVKINDSGEFHLKPANGGGHERKVATYMESMMAMICNHPAAIGCVRNFKLSGE